KKAEAHQLPHPHLAQEPRPGLFARERHTADEADDRRLLPHCGVGVEIGQLVRTHAQPRGFKTVGHCYQRIREAPQVKPPPIASIMTRSPRLMRPSVTAS